LFKALLSSTPIPNAVAYFLAFEAVSVISEAPFATFPALTKALTPPNPIADNATKPALAAVFQFIISLA